MKGRFSLVRVLTVMHPASFLEQLIVQESASYRIKSVAYTGGGVGWGGNLPHDCITALRYLKKNSGQ